VFDDYGYHGTPGITRCIDELVEERRAELFWVPLPPMQVVVFKTGELAGLRSAR
jgi:hypothetical protein